MRVLDLSNNKISHIERISHLFELEEFWANDNLINDSFDHLSYLFKPIPNFKTIYLEGNPIEKSSTQYRLKLKLALPRIKQIDALLTKPLDYTSGTRGED